MKASKVVFSAFLTRSKSSLLLFFFLCLNVCRSVHSFYNKGQNVSLLLCQHYFTPLWLTFSAYTNLVIIFLLMKMKTTSSNLSTKFGRNKFTPEFCQHISMLFCGRNMWQFKKKYYLSASALLSFCTVTTSIITFIVTQCHHYHRHCHRYHCYHQHCSLQ